MSGSWEASSGRFLLPNVSSLFHVWRYSITVIIQALCASELWLLPLSHGGQWRWQWRVMASVLGRADPCWPLGLNVPLYPSAWEPKSFAFPWCSARDQRLVAHRPDTGGSSYGCCVVGVQAAEDTWKYSALCKESAPHTCEGICCSSFPSQPFSKKMHWDCICIVLVLLP